MPNDVSLEVQLTDSLYRLLEKAEVYGRYKNNMLIPTSDYKRVLVDFRQELDAHLELIQTVFRKSR